MVIAEPRFVLNRRGSRQGPILRGTDRLTGAEVALKPARNDSANLAREYQVGRDVGGRGVVRTIDLAPAIATARGALVPGPFLVLEWIDGKQWPRRRSSPDKMLSLVASLLQGLAQMHRMGWMHLDLTPVNLRVRDEQVTILDLGHALRPAEAGKLRALHGTRGYIAPELVRRIDGTAPLGDEISLSADIWQVGVLAVQGLTGKLPPESTEDNPEWWVADLHSALEKESDTLRSNWHEFLSRCLSDLPTHRYADALRALSGLNTLFGTSFTVNPLVVDITTIRPRSLRRCLRWIGRRRQPDGRHILHCWGPPGSGRTSFLESLECGLRQHGWRILRWASPPEEGPPRLIGDSGPGTSVPLAILCDSPELASDAPPLAAWADDPASLILVISAGDSALPPISHPSWNVSRCPLRPLPPSKAVRWLRRREIPLLSASPHGGHPLLLRSEVDGPNANLEKRVAQWVRHYVTNSSSLERAAFLWLIGASTELERMAHALPPQWRRLLTSPGVVTLIAEKLPRQERLRIDRALSPKQRHLLIGSPRSLQEHARIADPDCARRRLRRQIAHCRKSRHWAAEWNWIRAGMKLQLLPQESWGRRLVCAKAFMSSKERAREHERALSELPASSPIAWSAQRMEFVRRGLLPDDPQWDTLANHAVAKARADRRRSLACARFPWHLMTLLSQAEFEQHLEALRTDGAQEHQVIRDTIEMLQEFRDITVAPHAGDLTDSHIDEYVHSLIAFSARCRRKEHFEYAQFVGQLCLAPASALSRPDVAFHLAIRLANHTLANGCSEAADVDLRNVCNYTPAHRLNSIRPWVELLEERARSQEALGYYDQAAKLHSSLGVVHIRSGNMIRAQDALVRAVSALPPHQTATVLFNLTTVAIYRGQRELAARTLNEHLRVARRIGLKSDGIDTRLLQANLDLACGRYQVAADAAGAILSHPQQPLAEHSWEAWQILLRSSLAQEERSEIEKVLAEAPKVDAPFGDVVRILARLWALRAHRKLATLRRTTPELIELKECGKNSTFGRAAYESAQADLLEQDGNEQMANEWRNRANARFDLLGWGHPVRSRSVSGTATKRRRRF